MGITRETSPATRQDELFATIPRIKIPIEEKAATLKAGEVKILSFVPKNKVGLAEFKFVPVEDLRQDPPALLPGDIAWATGWAIKTKNPAFEHPNWNGFMKLINQRKLKEKSNIDFLPIIEGDPKDYSTIYTILMECLRSSQYPAVVTFALQIKSNSDSPPV